MIEVETAFRTREQPKQRTWTPSMRNQSPGTALRFYRARTPISTRYSSSKPPPLPKAFHVKHPVSYPPVSMIPANARQPVDYAAGGRFQKQADATGREYLVDKLTGAWTPVDELTTNAPCLH